MWNQPILSANGTIGQDDFAVVSGGGADSDAYLAFDNDVSSYVNKMNADAWLIFYIKNSIKIDTVVLQSEGYLPASGKLQYSDDGTTWIDCGTWEDTEQAGNSATVDCNDKLNPHSYWRLYSLSRSVNYPSKNADFGNIIINGFAGNKGEFTLSFDTNRIVENQNFVRINLTSLVSWLKFDSSVTDDFISSNNWTTYGNPTIGTTNAICENALQLDGSSGVGCTLRLGGQDFTIDGWCFVDTSTPAYARIINIFKTSNNYPMFVLEKPSDTSNRFRLFASYYDNLSSGYNGNRSTSSIDCAGRRLHFRVCYSYSNAYFELYIDGERVAGVNAAKYPEQEFDVRFGSNKDEDGIIGSLDELRIYNGVSLNPANTNFTPPQAIDYDTHAFLFDTARLLKNKVTVDFDTQREVKKIWRYENYGSADLLIQSGTTVTDLADSQSKTGSAFYQSTWAKCFDIPASDEIWFKFDVYFNGSERWRAYNGGYNNTTGITAQLSGYNYIFSNGNELKGIANTAVKNQLQTILLHMLSSSSDGVIEAWVDGEKIYTYTGDVNHGADFADIYLQSDGAGTFFSNVIISNAPLSISDAVFEVRSKPIFFDTQRNLFKPVSLSCDTLRNVKEHIWRYENYGSADLLSIDNPAVTPSTVTDLYTWQAVYGTAFVNPNQQKCFDIPVSDEIWFKFDIWIDESANYDDGIKLSIGQNNSKIDWGLIETFGNFSVTPYANASPEMISDLFLSIDSRYTFLVHMLADATNGVIELWLGEYKLGYYSGNVNNGVNFSDFYIATSEYFFISNVIISNAEINFSENCKYPLELFFDTRRNRSLAYILQTDFDSLRNVVVSQILFNDTKRNVVASQDFFNDTLRNVRKSIYFNCDVARQIPHKLIITPAENGVFTDAVNSTGVQSIEIELAAQQLTDRLTYTSINYAQILQEVQGQYLDYNFDMRIEETNQQGILTTCQCCSDIDELLYSQITYKIHSDYKEYEIDRVNRKIKQILTPADKLNVDSDSVIKGAWLSSHLEKIAGAIGKQFDTSDIQFNDFVSDMELEQDHVTYQDVLSDLVGWTSRVPQMLINVFIRGNNLCAIQRNYEKNTIDITNSKHTVPIIKRQLMRTTWGSSPDENFTITRHHYESYSFEPPPKTSDDGKTHYTYRQVSSNIYLLVGARTNNDDGSFSTVSYHYSLSPPYELTGESHYSYDANGNINEHSEIHHKTLTPSQRHTKKVVDGDEESSVIGSHVAGMYNGKKVIAGAYDSTETALVEGNPLIDTNFPVLDDDKLAEITEAVKWLNRKTQETISIDIYDYPHVIDFNDRIFFNGNIYFLVSNTVLKNPRIVNKQSIQFVRWY